MAKKVNRFHFTENIYTHIHTPHTYIHIYIQAYVYSFIDYIYALFTLYMHFQHSSSQLHNRKLWIPIIHAWSYILTLLKPLLDATEICLQSQILDNINLTQCEPYSVHVSHHPCLSAHSDHAVFQQKPSQQ